MTTTGRPERVSLRMYDELAAWWPLLSPPEEYVEEAEDLLPRLKPVADSGTALRLMSRFRNRPQGRRRALPAPGWQ